MDFCSAVLSFIGVYFLATTVFVSAKNVESVTRYLPLESVIPGDSFHVVYKNGLYNKLRLACHQSQGAMPPTIEIVSTRFQENQNNFTLIHIGKIPFRKPVFVKSGRF